MYCKECFAEEGADFKPVTVSLKSGKQTASSGCAALTQPPLMGLSGVVCTLAVVGTGKTRKMM